MKALNPSSVTHLAGSCVSFLCMPKTERHAGWSAAFSTGYRLPDSVLWGPLSALQCKACQEAGSKLWRRALAGLRRKARESGVLPFECHQLEGVQVVNVDGHVEGSHSCNPMSNWHLCTCACIAACAGQPTPRTQGWHDSRRVLPTQQAELVCLPSSNPC